MKQEHPDTGEPFDVERFRRIRDAYEALMRSGGESPSGPSHPVSWTGGFQEPLRPFQEVRRRAEARPEPTPVHLDLVLTPAEAAAGGVVSLSVARPGGCHECGGTGRGFFGLCQTCRGGASPSGRERIELQLPRGVRQGALVRARTSSGRVLVARVRISR